MRRHWNIDLCLLCPTQKNFSCRSHLNSQWMGKDEYPHSEASPLDILLTTHSLYLFFNV